MGRRGTRVARKWFFLTGFLLQAHIRNIGTDGGPRHQDNLLPRGEAPEGGVVRSQHVAAGAEDEPVQAVRRDALLGHHRLREDRLLNPGRRSLPRHLSLEHVHNARGVPRTVRNRKSLTRGNATGEDGLTRWRGRETGMRRGRAAAARRHERERADGHRPNPAGWWPQTRATLLLHRASQRTSPVSGARGLLVTDCR
jgi:hypothetical protein